MGTWIKMSLHTINITNLSGAKGTVVPDAGFNYTDNLNDIDEATLKFSGTGLTRRELVEIGSTVEIYKDGTLAFKGIIDLLDTLEAGTLIIHSQDEISFRLSKENGSYANSPWNATASATIFSNIIGDSSYISAGTIDTGFSTDFRLNDTQSIWNSITNLAKKTTQDVGKDYANTEIDILDHKGSSTSVATFNKGIEIQNVRFTQGYPLGNKVIVRGKGDGVNQAKGSASDAGSIATYGTITRNVNDPSCINDDECDKLAEAELATTLQKSKVYDFDVINVNQDLDSGDIITLNAKDIGLINEEVRIVGIERGDGPGGEYLRCQVVNPELKQLMRNRNKILSRIVKNQQDQITYMHGSGNTNTWGAGINAKTNYPLKIVFFLPASYIEDEVGDINVKELTVSYDIDPYRSDIGTASFTGSDPQVQNSSADQGANLTGSMDDNDDYGVSDNGILAGGGFGSSTTHASFTGIATFSNVTGAFTLFTITVIPDSASDTYTFRIYDSDSATYYPNSSGISIVSAAAGDYISLNIVVPDNIVNNDLVFQVQNASSGFDYYILFQAFGEHAHGFASLDAADHQHSNGGYDINAADINHISVGDDVSEAGSVNASSTNLYLDFWNGSTWVNKHSILATGATLGTDVDISNSGAYPDSSGYWRVRVEPITATADFAQAIVKLKNSVDN
jgi:hypothetical protein